MSLRWLFLFLGLDVVMPGAASAQSPVRGYLLNVAQGNSSGSSLPAAGSDFTRIRLMGAFAVAAADVDVAVESTLLLRPRAASLTIRAGAPSGSGDWIDLDGVPHEGSHAVIRYRVDRLSIGLSRERFQVKVGRQTVSWATTLFLTPADPFVPFDPADPFREYRAGVDAVRLEYFAGPFTGMDVVLRPASTPVGKSVTALGRFHTSAAQWDLAAWTGVLHDEPAISVSAARSVGGWAVRSEWVARRDSSNTVLRGAVGADRNIGLSGRDVHFAAEYQYDGLGARDAGQIAAVSSLPAFQRGEMQVTGRHALALQTSLQVHPLVSVQLLTLVDASDGSALLAPAGGYSASDNVSVRAGIYRGIGDDALDPAGIPITEFGSLPWIGYVSLSWFF